MKSELQLQQLRQLLSCKNIEDNCNSDFLVL